MRISGPRLGQAENLAHVSLMAEGAVPLDNPKEFKERTRLYIELLSEIDKEFDDPEDWTDKKPEPKPTPVKLDFGDGKVIDTETN